MSKIKLGSVIIAIISIVVIAIVAICLYIYWPAIKGTIDNSKYYSQDDLQNSYNDGFSDGNKSEQELTAKYEYYKSLVDDYYSQIDVLTKELSMVNSLNFDYEKQIKNLTENKTNLENLVKNLQNDNQTNAETIRILNSQIFNLQNQINEMNEFYQNSFNQIKILNDKINDLQKSIIYYESFIANLETGEQVVATFEFDGSVYNVQILNKGSKLSVVAPPSTDYIIFNGWTIDGEFIDLDAYEINSNVKIIADITYKYLVNFKVDDTLYNSQFVEKNNFVQQIENPEKEKFVFEGWTIDGFNIIDINNYEIVENTTFVAKFKQVFKVDFIVNNVIFSSIEIVSGDYIKEIVVPNLDGYRFLGWTLNGEDVITNIENIAVYSNIQYIAKLELYGTKFDYSSLNKIKSDTINVVFDKYTTSDKKYIVDNKNVIEDIPINFYGYSKLNFTASDSNIGTVDFFYDTNTKSAYFLSENVIFLPNDISNLFLDFSRLENLTFLNFNTINVTNMSNMFKNCRNLESLNLSNFNTINVTNMNGMFYDCSSLKSLNLSNLNTTNVTNMSSMFDGCYYLDNLNLSNFDTTNVTDMSSMFKGCVTLSNIDLSNFNTSNVINMNGMFYACSSLKSLNLSNFDTTNVTNMSSMFYSCGNLSNLDLSSFNTSNVESFYQMFRDCTNLVNLDLSSFITTNLNNVSRMFYKCTSLQNIFIGLSWDVSSVSSYTGMFDSCNNLPNFNSQKTGNLYAHANDGGYLTLKESI